MKATIIRNFSGLLSFCLSLLGFSACAGDPMVEYGTPSATYKVKGQLIIEKSLAPAKGIRVTIPETYSFNRPDTVFSDNSGKFEISLKSFPDSNKTVHLKFEDVDGAANGEFETKTDSTSFVDSKFTGGDGHWYSGEATKDMGAISLHLK